MIYHNVCPSVHCETFPCFTLSHALRMLRAHGLCDVALQTVYRAVVVARLLYAASAWWGFTTAADRQRIEGFLCRSVRAGYTTVRTSRRPPSWSKTRMISCSTVSSTTAATFCIHCFQIVALTHMPCALADITFP